MEFCKSETYRNLAKAYAGECQAGMRYQFIAKQAMREELPVLADTVKEIAKNETVHARAFYDEITQRIKGEVKIGIEADYPYWFSALDENLEFAARGEREEHETIYSGFAKTAEEEDFKSVSILFSRIAEIEKHHEILFAYLANAVKEGTLYRAQHSVVWVCSECGHMHTSEEAWKVCPVCKKPQGYVFLHLPYKGEDRQ